MRSGLRSSALVAGATAAGVAAFVHALSDFSLRVPATALAPAACLAVALPAPPSRLASPPPAARVAIVAAMTAMAALALLASVAPFQHQRGAGAVRNADGSL